MQHVHDIFHANLDRVRSIHALQLSFQGLVAPIVDLSDILRSEIVLIVSALDHFVHEVVRIGMMDTWAGKRTPTASYLRFSVSLGVTTQLASPIANSAVLENEIRERHSYLAFQQPEKIAEAIRLISNVELWNEVAKTTGGNPQDIKSQLKLIVDRRNKIAHEADIDPSFPGQRWPIKRADCEDALSFVEKVGDAIFSLVK